MHADVREHAPTERNEPVDTFAFDPDDGVAVTLAVMPNREVATDPERVANLDEDEANTEDFAERYDDLTYRCRMVSPP